MKNDARHPRGVAKSENIRFPVSSSDYFPDTDISNIEKIMLQILSKDFNGHHQYFKSGSVSIMWKYRTYLNISAKKVGQKWDHTNWD